MWFCFTGDSRGGGKVNGAQSGLSIEHKAADPSSLMMMLVVIFMYLQLTVSCMLAETQ